MWRFLALCLPFFFYAQNTTDADIKPYEDAEAYNVYAAVLALEKSKGDLLIADTTVPFNQCADSGSDEALGAAVESYKRANHDRWRLGYHFQLQRPYKVLSPKEASQLLERDERTGKWPLSPSNGIHRFSAVGFNSGKTIAFVEMDVICGGLCGHGSPFILQKNQGAWVKYSPQAPPPTQNPDGTWTATFSGTICTWAY